MVQRVKEKKKQVDVIFSQSGPMAQGLVDVSLVIRRLKGQAGF